MAKRTKGKKWAPVPTQAARGTFIPDAPPPDVGTYEEPAPPEPVDEDLEEILQQLPQETKVELAKWDDKMGDWKYSGRFPAHGFSLELVAQQRGAGRYRFIVRGPKDDPDTGKPRVQVLAKRQFYIDEAMAPAVPVPAHVASPMEAGMMQVMEANLRMTQVMLTALGQRETASDMVAALAPLLKPPAGDKDDLFKLLLVEVLKDRGGTGGSVKDMLAMFREGMELAKGVEADPMATVGAELVKLVTRGMDSGEARRALPPGSAENPPTPTVPPADAQVVKDIQSLVADLGGLFARVSRQGIGNVDGYVQVLAYELDARPSLDPHVESWFADPTYPDMVVPLFPEVDPTWLRLLLLKVRDVLTEDASEPAPRLVRDGEPAAPEGSGNGANASEDAATGERQPNHAKSSRRGRPHRPGVRQEP